MWNGIQVGIFLTLLLDFCLNDLVVGLPIINAESDFYENGDSKLQYHTRSKRYVLSKEKWPKHTLRWQLHSNRLNPSDMFIIRMTLHRAFEIWSSVSALEFIEITKNDTNKELPADIDILFLKGKHGDGLPFDGPQGVVAHAFYPPVGALHFDADENWTLNRNDGINFYQTAVHEIGHLLGLEHSSDFRAVMYPRNRKFEPDYQLGDDDVRAIRRLYS